MPPAGSTHTTPAASSSPTPGRCQSICRLQLGVAPNPQQIILHLEGQPEQFAKFAVRLADLPAAPAQPAPRYMYRLQQGSGFPVHHRPVIRLAQVHPPLIRQVQDTGPVSEPGRSPVKPAPLPAPLRTRQSRQSQHSQLRQRKQVSPVLSACAIPQRVHSVARPRRSGL